MKSNRRRRSRKWKRNDVCLNLGVKPNEYLSRDIQNESESDLEKPMKKFNFKYKVKLNPKDVETRSYKGLEKYEITPEDQDYQAKIDELYQNYLKKTENIDKHNLADFGRSRTLKNELEQIPEIYKYLDLEEDNENHQKKLKQTALRKYLEVKYDRKEYVKNISSYNNLLEIENRSESYEKAYTELVNDIKNKKEADPIFEELPYFYKSAGSKTILHTEDFKYKPKAPKEEELEEPEEITEEELEEIEVVKKDYSGITKSNLVKKGEIIGESEDKAINGLRNLHPNRYEELFLNPKKERFYLGSKEHFDLPEITEKQRIAKRKKRVDLFNKELAHLKRNHLLTPEMEAYLKELQVIERNVKEFNRKESGKNKGEIRFNKDGSPSIRTLNVKRDLTDEEMLNAIITIHMNRYKLDDKFKKKVFDKNKFKKNLIDIKEYDINTVDFKDPKNHDKLNAKITMDHYTIDDYNAFIKEVEKDPDLLNEMQVINSEITQKYYTINSLSGNQIQTRMLPTNNGYFAGLFYQKTKESNPLKTFNESLVMIADDDDISHFQAEVLRCYNPNNRKDMIVLNPNAEERPFDEEHRLMAYKGYTMSKVDSAGYERSKQLVDQFRERFGKRGLAYLTPEASGEVNITDQKLMLADFIHNNTVTMEVNTIDNKQMVFKDHEIEQDFENLETKNVKMVFIPKKFTKQQKEDLINKNYISDLEKIVEEDNLIHNSDSNLYEFKGEQKGSIMTTDELTKLSQKRLGIDIPAVEKQLQSLYFRGWINYPRISAKKGELERRGVEINKDGVRSHKEAKEKVDSEFKGSHIERSILDIILSGMKAKEENRQFAVSGSWMLIGGRTTKKDKKADKIIGFTEATIEMNDERKYTHDKMDLKLGQRGVGIEETGEYIIDNNLSTEATRGKILKEMEDSGIIVRSGNHYILDGRGLFFVALNHYIEELELPRVNRIKSSIQKVNYDKERYRRTNESVESDMQEIECKAGQFMFISDEGKKHANKYLSEYFKELIEAEKDIIKLEAV